MALTYILNRTKILNDGTMKSVEQSYHDTLMKAQTKFHRNIATDMEDSTLNGSISIITDTMLNKHDSFVWNREDVK